MTQPVISPDGRFRWNGAKWVPVAVKLTPDLGAPRFMWKPSAGFKVFVAVFVLGLIAAGIAGAMDEAQAEQDSHDAFCEGLGVGDPECD